MYPYQTYQKPKTYVQPGFPIQAPITYPGQNPYPYAQPPTQIPQTACVGSNYACCQPCEVVFKEKFYQQPPTYLQPTPPFVVQQNVYQQQGYSPGAAGYGAGLVYGQPVEQACCYGQHCCHDCC